MHKEIEKAEIEITDNGENPEAPHPKDMIDLEVCILDNFISSVFIICSYTLLNVVLKLIT